MTHKVSGWKNLRLVPLLGALLLVGGTAAARVNNCDQRIHRAEESLEKAVRRHGEHSRAAERRRHHLEEVRRSCRDRDHGRDRR